MAGSSPSTSRRPTGRAIAPADYAAATGTLTFAGRRDDEDGQRPRVAGDTLDEIDETFTLSLSNAVNVTVVDGLGLGTITDNDPPPTLCINDVTVTEGDSGTGGRHLHRQPQRPERARGLRQLRVG